MMKLIYLIEDKVVFEPDTSRLWPANEPESAVTLYAPVSQCLFLLVQHPLEVLSQEFFFNEVWRKNGLYVNANTLYQNMALLRKALHAMGIKKDVIKTVPRQGMKFIGAVRILGDETSEVSPALIQETVPELAGHATEALAANNILAKKDERNKSLARYIYYLPFIITALSLIALLPLMTKGGKDHQTDYLSHYYVSGRVGQCQLLSSSPDKEQTLHYFSRLSDITGMRCRDNELVWVTYNSSNRIVSAVKCDKTISISSADCAVWMFRESQYE
ncbi:winged helix-turn-helix domain-containing protein [Enterobacter cloacae]|uniref:winged helix-turn-helix domain-containing protein n=1 Tax=Enterobacter cloacae TaxID=550 RepID=UPI0030C087BA